MVFSDTYQMTYAEDRKPLLRLDSGEGGDIDDLEHFTEMLNPYCTTSNKFYYGKKGLLNFILFAYFYCF